MKNRRVKEENINAIIHFPFAIIATGLLFSTPPSHVPFFLCSFLTFFLSFVYHSTNDNLVLKASRRQFDIASIFWLIPATIFHYLPPQVGLLFFALSAVLSLPVMLTWTSDFFTDTALITLSVVGGLLCVLFGTIDMSLAAGLIAYACGLCFYFRGERPWMHTTWHVFVCVGWSVHAWGNLWL